MKKQILAAAAILALSAGAAGAAITTTPGNGVKGSAHDMIAAGKGTDSQGRICAFCHTPHHADTSISESTPLWSRTNTASGSGRTYIAYYSPTFDLANSTNAPADPAYGPTRLCLTCHDSGIAASTHYGQNDNITTNLNGDSWGGWDIGAGRSLQNDHPVGFSYGDVVCGSSGTTNNDNTVGTCGSGKKNYVRGVGASNDLKFINNEGISVGERLTDGMMTCATCHDVHNKKNKFATPDTNVTLGGYLVLAPQKDSALCLTCHIK